MSPCGTLLSTQNCFVSNPLIINVKYIYIVDVKSQILLVDRGCFIADYSGTGLFFSYELL